MHTLEQLRAGELSGVTRLQLKAGLTSFPREIFDLAESLEILDLSGNALSSLPDDLPRLHRLRVIFCSDNRFTALPSVLGRCARLTMIGFKANRIARVPAEALPPQLRWLILTDNAIERLPPDIGRCTQMQKLMLAGNRLTSLPEALANCRQLELLRIAANQLTELPAWLLDLPRLAWLAFGGNPFCAPLEQQALAQSSVPLVAWDTLAIGRKLGEGASGVIHQAARIPAEGARVATPQSSGETGDVAVKLFKGAVTSDGLPQSEMAACIAAGAHPDLIPVRGRLHGHPDGTQGLVMPLIDPDYRNLAGPPSLDTCTRDVYDDGKRFNPAAMLRIAYGVAAAAAHLHAKGILHGDLYGHNTLHCSRGRTLLGDFGAASLFDPGGPLAAGLQRIEARAFGCLLEELLDRCDGLRPELAARLLAWAGACQDAHPAARPPLSYVARQLTQVLDNPF